MESWTLSFYNNAEIETQSISVVVMLAKMSIRESGKHQDQREGQKMPRKIIKPRVLERNILFSCDRCHFPKSKCKCK